MIARYRVAMTDSLLIFNERSGGCDPALITEVERLFAESGWPIGEKIALGDGVLPGAHGADAAGLGLIVVLSGDGSLRTVADALAGWDGTLLVLPGGTMNLLAHALHGDLDAPAIVRAYLDGRGTVMRTPVIQAGDITAYTGMIIGPTAAWGDVREAMRNRDVAALARDVPRALSATLGDPGVRIAGSPADYPAIFVAPAVGGLHAHGVLASGAGDLFAHGWAWLAGDFRQGPSDDLGIAPALSVGADGDTLDLLVDGEAESIAGPLELRLARSGVRFFAAQGEAGWR
jgi:hypothetical protein